MTNADHQDSGIIAARLTPPGRGAVASVRLICTTSDQAAALDDAFTAASGMRPSEAPVDRVLFGSWRGEDVVLVRTAAAEWEVHCHGGEAAVTRIISEFQTAPPARPESAIDELLLQTRTTKTARLVLAQAGGVLRNALSEAVEATTDDVFRECLQELLRWQWLVPHLVEPWCVVIAGPPNVGKSSLMNAIAGYERAIVYDQPGTTRDAVRTELVLDGWPFCLIDTAGIRRQTDDPVESLGIAGARNLLDVADLILIAVDHTVGWTDEHEHIVAAASDDTPKGIVCCKCDLPRRGPEPPDGWTVLRTSAEQGDGLEQLADWITSRLISETPTLSTPLPVAGSAELSADLLQRLDDGESLPRLQQELSSWLTLQPW